MAQRRLDPLDLVLYAPLGALIELRAGVPKLARTGRAHVDAQLVTARSIGQFAVQQAERRLPDAVDDLRRRGEDALASWGLLPPRREDEPDDEPEPLADVVQLGGQVEEAGPDAGSLAIADYDSLSAVQVVPRLEALDPDDLRAVGDYERAHRARRTILHRVEQLLEGEGT